MKHAARRTLDRGGQFVLLGSASDPKVQVMPADQCSRFDGRSTTTHLPDRLT